MVIFVGFEILALFELQRRTANPHSFGACQPTTADKDRLLILRSTLCGSLPIPVLGCVFHHGRL